jgi:dihydropteroate synthase
MTATGLGATSAPLPRATHWRLRTRTLSCAERPLWMGIVNVTPDSFSDGGRFLDPDRAIAHAVQLWEQGADILDIGGESTRPYAEPVPAEEELRRVLPVLQGLRRRLPDAVLSIDTSKAAVAEAALALGVEIVNDVTGLTGDAAMLPLVAARQAAVCVMHMQGTPQTMQDHPTYQDVVAEVYDYLRQRRDALVAAGVAQERICLDPGIGFGKTHAHNLALMVHCQTLLDLGCPVLVGHSRKGFLAKLIGDPQADRTAATIGGALALALKGVHVIRVHDVAPVRQAWTVFAACAGGPPVGPGVASRSPWPSA